MTARDVDQGSVLSPEIPVVQNIAGSWYRVGAFWSAVPAHQSQPTPTSSMRMGTLGPSHHLCTVPRTVAIQGISKTAFDDYWNAGAIGEAYVASRLVAPRTIGLFEYACLFNGPYERVAAPSELLLANAHVDATYARSIVDLEARLPQQGAV